MWLSGHCMTFPCSFPLVKMSNTVSACLIMHNMCVLDRVMDAGNVYALYDPSHNKNIEEQLTIGTDTVGIAKNLRVWLSTTAGGWDWKLLWRNSGYNSCLLDKPIGRNWMIGTNIMVVFMLHRSKWKDDKLTSNAIFNSWIPHHHYWCCYSCCHLPAKNLSCFSLVMLVHLYPAPQLLSSLLTMHPHQLMSGGWGTISRSRALQSSKKCQSLLACNSCSFAKDCICLQGSNQILGHPIMPLVALEKVHGIEAASLYGFILAAFSSDCCATFLVAFFIQIGLAKLLAPLCWYSIGDFLASSYLFADTHQRSCGGNPYIFHCLQQCHPS